MNLRFHFNKLNNHTHIIDFSTIMKYYLQISILLVIFIFDNVSSCKYSEKNKRYECRTPDEISAESTDEWTNLLILYNSNKTRFAVNNDTFRRAPNLKELAVSVSTFNHIEPDAFIGLKKLDYLIIYDTNLEEIPTRVLDNLPIRSIRLQNTTNQISPGFFANLPDIKFVYVYYNTIKKLKVGIFNNTPIYKLYLPWNEIETIESGAFSNMESMIFLSLSGNKLTSFDSQLLVGKPNSIQQFKLNGNNFTQITKNMFTVLDDLKQLELDFNQIESIEDESFYYQQELNFLDISNNKLKEIRPKIFPTGMEKMVALLFRSNQLTFFNNAIFVRTPNLKFISCTGNPFQCPCLEEIKDWTDKRNITRLCDGAYFSGDRPVCLFTDIQKNKCIYDVELTENLYEIYKAALNEYPTVNLKCDTSKGADNAILRKTYQ